MAAQSSVHTAEVGSVVVLTLRGEHDIATRAILAATIAEHARPGAAMVVDLTPATFIDSTVLHALVTASRDADILAVVAPPGELCRRMLEITGLDAALAVCESTDHALRHVLCAAQPRDTATALGLLQAADHLLDIAWESGHDTSEPLRLARELSQAVGREPLIEDAKLLIADAQRCTPSEAFQSLVHFSQLRNQRIADIARRLAEGTALNGVSARSSRTVSNQTLSAHQG